MKFPQLGALLLLVVAGLSGGAGWAQTPETPGAPQAKPYVMFWRQVGGNWSAGPFATQTATCVHASPLAACNGQNFKGVYLDGQYTLFWINGCGRPPITIQCEVRPAPAQ